MIDAIPLAGDIILVAQSIQAAQSSLSQRQTNWCFCPTQALDIQRRRAFIRCVFSQNEILDTFLGTVGYDVPESSIRGIV